MTRGFASVLEVIAHQVALSPSGLCLLTTGELAACAGVSERTVQRALSHWEDVGVIQCAYVPGQRRAIDVVEPVFVADLTRMRSAGLLP